MIDARKYFETRLQGHRFAGRDEQMVKCPFHEDRTASLSVKLGDGVWFCHAGCGSGGVLDFEMKLSKCDRETAKANVAAITGNKQAFSPSEKPEAVYQFHDADGRLVFEKLRYPGKRFVQRKPNGKGGWEYKLEGVSKPLYRLQELITANTVFICEGEKDCDNLREALGKATLPPTYRIAVTTNFDGAGKWKEDYAPFFAGKKVTILPDNDEIGRKHAEQVAASVSSFASGTKVVSLPGLQDHGDVSDFLQAHSIEELFAEIKKAKSWQRPIQPQKLFVDAPDFINSVPDKLDWLVEGVIERGANGFFAANPKAGKSWAAVDLALSLAMGVDWLGFKVPEPVRVALVSREDNPALTAWRMKHLFRGKRGARSFDIDKNLYVNSRGQSKQLMLDVPEQVDELMAALKELRPAIALFDVFNCFHSMDENDNTQMRVVLQRLTQIQAEIGCQIGVVHHFSKGGEGSLTQRMRGASAIAGWCEWLIGIGNADEETKLRKMEFELKAAQPPEPVYYRIESDAEVAKLERTQPVQASQSRGRSAAERFMQ